MGCGFSSPHDNAMVRRGVALLLSLEKSWSVCGEAPSSEEVLKQAEELRPDVILLDVSTRSIDRLETTRLATRGFLIRRV